MTPEQRRIPPQESDQVGMWTGTWAPTPDQVWARPRESQVKRRWGCSRPRHRMAARWWAIRPAAGPALSLVVLRSRLYRRQKPRLRLPSTAELVVVTFPDHPQLSKLTDQT